MTHRDTGMAGMTTITHPNKVVNNVTIETNNKSMATHINIRDSYIIIYDLVLSPSLILSSV